MKLEKVNKIIIHCSDSQDSLDIGFKEINYWHKQNGWMSDSGVSCGYHYIIRKNGNIEKGRNLDEAGAHVRGHNKDSVGICWVGRDDLNDKQLKSLKTLVKTMMRKYGLDLDDVFGHYEFDPGKTCPNLDMHKFRAELLFK